MADDNVTSTGWEPPDRIEKDELVRISDRVLAEREIPYSETEDIFRINANGMDWDNLIKLGIFLTDRSFVPVYREVRARMLGDVAPPSTLVVVSGLADERWLVEVDAYAAKKHFAHQRR